MTSASTSHTSVCLEQRAAHCLHLAPGLGLCLATTAVAFALQVAEQRLFGRMCLEALVLAILTGAAVRTAWTPGARWRPGVEFGAKTLLEVAIVLLGASVSAANLLAVGPALLVGIAGVVAAVIGASYGLGRLLGLPRRLATLVACGNSICGNSAIATVAPVIGADGEDVAAAIAFTAVLGVAVVLGLPLLALALRLDGMQGGVLAGLTVYAVPQVLAAAAPLGPAAVQVGTLVKLVRVLMLGPVCLVLSLLKRRLRDAPNEPVPEVTAGDRPRSGRHAVHSFVPWFILGFLLMVTARSLGALPAAAMPILARVSTALTVVSMAALGLGTDVRAVARAGGRVTGTVVLSLLVLCLASLGLIHLLRIG